VNVSHPQASEAPAVDDFLRLLALFALIGGNAFLVIGEYSVVTARGCL
jgi:hypothetical protein